MTKFTWLRCTHKPQLYIGNLNSGFNLIICVKNVCKLHPTLCSNNDLQHNPLCGLMGFSPEKCAWNCIRRFGSYGACACMGMWAPVFCNLPPIIVASHDIGHLLWQFPDPHKWIGGGGRGVLQQKGAITKISAPFLCRHNNYLPEWLGKPKFCDT